MSTPPSSLPSFAPDKRHGRSRSSHHPSSSSTKPASPSPLSSSSSASASSSTAGYGLGYVPLAPSGSLGQIPPTPPPSSSSMSSLSSSLSHLSNLSLSSTSSTSSSAPPSQYSSFVSLLPAPPLLPLTAPSAPPPPPASSHSAMSASGAVPPSSPPSSYSTSSSRSPSPSSSRSVSLSPSLSPSPQPLSRWESLPALSTSDPHLRATKQSLQHDQKAHHHHHPSHHQHRLSDSMPRSVNDDDHMRGAQLDRGISLSTPNLTDIGGDLALLLQKKPRPYKKRRRLSAPETKLLMDSFEKNPKPNSKTRAKLAIMIPGMSERTIQIWFQNRRAKVKQGLRDIPPGFAGDLAGGAGGVAPGNMGRSGSNNTTPTTTPTPTSSGSLKFTHYTHSTPSSSPTYQLHGRSSPSSSSSSLPQAIHPGLGAPALSSPREHAAPQHASDYRQNYFQFSVNMNSPKPSGSKAIPAPASTPVFSASAFSSAAQTQGQVSNPSLPPHFPLDLHMADARPTPPALQSPRDQTGQSHASHFPFPHMMAMSQPPSSSSIQQQQQQHSMSGLGYPLTQMQLFPSGVPPATPPTTTPTAPQLSSPSIALSRSLSEPSFAQLPPLTSSIPHTPYSPRGQLPQVPTFSFPPLVQHHGGVLPPLTSTSLAPGKSPADDAMETQQHQRGPGTATAAATPAVPAPAQAPAEKGKSMSIQFMLE